MDNFDVPIGGYDSVQITDLGIYTVGYHLPFQHNERFHLPYMAVAEISLGISLRVFLYLNPYPSPLLLEISSIHM